MRTIKTANDGHYDSVVEYEDGTVYVTRPIGDDTVQVPLRDVEALLNGTTDETAHAIRDRWEHQTDDIDFYLDGTRFASVEVSQIEELLHVAPSFEEYMADEYGYDPDGALWDGEPYLDAVVDIDFVTSFFADLRGGFAADDNVEVVYATIGSDGNLRLGLADDR